MEESSWADLAASAVVGGRGAVGKGDKEEDGEEEPEVESWDEEEADVCLMPK